MSILSSFKNQPIVKNKRRRSAFIAIFLTFLATALFMFLMQSFQDLWKKKFIEYNMSTAYQELVSARNMFHEIDLNTSRTAEQKLGSFINSIVSKLRIGESGDAFLLDENLNYIYDGSPDVSIDLKGKKLYDALGADECSPYKECYENLSIIGKKIL